MKKYTIVYSISYHRGTVTKYVVSEGETAQKAIENSGIHEGDIWFVFEGECKSVDWAT